VWLVAREVFRSRAAVRYTLTVAAFSPGALLNLSDPGVIEYSAYSLICAAAYLRFIAVPSRKRFWALCTAALLVSIAPGYHILLSGVAPLAILFLASLVASPVTRSALRSVRVLDALVAIALVFAVATPSVLAYAQQHDDVVFTQVGGLGYPFGALKPGNPLQFLMASVPGVWFDWDPDSYLQSADGPISQLRVRSMRWGKTSGTSTSAPWDYRWLR